MSESHYKEVYFHDYCCICEHLSLGGHQDPCCECLGNPMNIDSHKPVNFKEKLKWEK